MRIPSRLASRLLLAAAVALPGAALMIPATTLSATPATPAARNLAAADAFLAANGKLKGRFVTPSGLQYQVLKVGKGAKPGRIDKVTVKYVGRLLSGQIFDQTYDDPATFQVSQVIPGWVEALQMMPEGSMWRLWVPPRLGYGAEGADIIPPNALLIFDVTLLKVEKRKLD